MEPQASPEKSSTRRVVGFLKENVKATFPGAIDGKKGTKFEKLETQGDYMKVVLLDGTNTTGWVPRKSCKRADTTSSSNNPHSGSPSMTASTDLLESVEQLRRLVFDLKTEGVEIAQLKELEELIPSVVIVGPQSAGKSTLLNRLLPPSMQGSLSLPSGSGTCTKMPIVINFTRTNQPSLSYIFAGKAKQQFGPFVNYTEEQWNRMGDHVTQLNSAQPDIVPDNKIFLNIGAPDVLPFTYIDTPGLKSGKPDLANLLKSEIALADIVLVAHAASYDWDSCDPFLWAEERKKADPDVVIIGVATKCEGYIEESDIVKRLRVLETARVVPAFVAAGTPQYPISLADEVHHLRGLYQNIPSSVILGATALRQRLFREYNSILMSRKELIIEAINMVREDLNKQLNKIGREPKSPNAVKTDLSILVSEFQDRDLSPQIESLINAASDKFGPCFHESFMAKALEDKKLQNFLDRTRKALVPGTEGVYDILLLVFKDIASMIGPKIHHAIAESVELLKSGLVRALQDATEKNTPHRMVISTAISPKLSDVAEAERKNFLNAITERIFAKPATDETYSHTGLHMSELYLAVEPQINSVLKDSTTGQMKESYSLQEMRSVIEILGRHLILERSDNIWFCNIKNVTKWYWKIYRQESIADAKRRVEATMKLLLKAAADALTDLDVSKVNVEDGEVKRLRQLFLEALVELEEIQTALLEVSS